MSIIHPAKNATPPIGVTAPKMLMPVKLNTYKLPEKIIIPASIKYPAVFKVEIGPSTCYSSISQ